MNSDYYRRQIESKRKQRLDAEKKAADFRNKEAAKRADASRARSAASKTSSSTTRESKLREAQRREDDANTAAKQSASWQERASDYSKQEARLLSSLAKAEQTEAEAIERQRKQAERLAAAEAAAMRQTMDSTMALVSGALHELRAPKPERLRILLLGASSDGDLRVGREQARIRLAVERALHRDLVELDGRPAATTSDLLDGITRFRPHVVHFSGHSGNDLLEFEDDLDAQHIGVAVSAGAFGSAVAATDDPPILVVLNSCDSSAQLAGLVQGAVPFVIGMSDSISDGDAIAYAAQFYAAVANGQSILSAHMSGKAALELAGLPGADLPELVHAADVDPKSTILVVPPRE